jgi:hypothetical protein
MKHHQKLREEAARVGAAQTRTPEVAPPINGAARVMLDHLHSVQVSTQQQLDILRKTRGQRVVGEVRIPAHLQVPTSLDVSGVESRGNLLPIRGPRD